MRQPPSPITENTEEERAFLQKRVALYWKVLFFMVLIGTGLGGFGAIKKPGVDLVVTFGVTGMLGLLWALSRSGQRSIRFSRAVEVGGVLLFSISSAVLGRLILPGFARDHGLVSGPATTMADGFVTMLCLETGAVQISLRAALIPSRPRRTLILTALFGLPTILAVSLLVPTADGGITWRPAGSDALPWLPPTLVMVWGFAVVGCTVISWVIYGLRAEIREARRFGQYVLEHKLGEGAMGVVYRATHALLRRPAAIKLILKDRASESDLLRFEREVQITSRLVHPNTISIFDYGRTAEGVFYYVMEYLDGLDLQRLVEQYGPVEPARAIHIVAQVSGALGRGARPGPHPPRHQARQHRPHRAPRRARCRQGRRLRSREDVRRQPGRVGGRRRHHRHASVHGSRGHLAARHRRRTFRSVRRGRRRVFPAHGTARVRGRVRPRGLQQAHAGGAGASIGQTGEAASRGSRSHRARVSREESRRSSRVGRAPAKRAACLRRRHALRPAGRSGLVAGLSRLAQRQPDAGQ